MRGLRPIEQVQVTYAGADEVVWVWVKDRRYVGVEYASGRVVKYFYNNVVSERDRPKPTIHLPPIEE